MDYPLCRNKLLNAKPFVFMGAIHFDDENNISLPEYILNRISASEKYIANTEFEKNCLIKLGIEAKKINVIGCGVNISDFGISSKMDVRKKLGIEENDFVIGYVGRFAINKDIATLISAFDRNHKDNWRLILAGGSNSYYYEIKKLVYTSFSKISKKIIFIIDFDEVLKEEIYSSLDVFVSPSYSESFGIVFLEAWASKLPVIGTNIGAIKSVISDGEDGRLFEAHNDVQLAKLLLYYSENIQIRLLHGISGHNKLVQHYTWDIIAEKYRNTYIEAISIFKSKYRCAE
jgi:glycosyltransferase involved in cell wall biosynthesis